MPPGDSATERWLSLSKQYQSNEGAIMVAQAKIREAQASIDFSTQVDPVTGKPVTDILGLSAKSESATAVISAQRLQIESLEEQNAGLINRMASIDPDLTVSYYPDRMNEVLAGQASLAKSLGGGGSAPTYQFQVGAGGEVYRISSGGSFEYMKTIPELAEKSTQVVVDERTGESIALTFDSNGEVTKRTPLGEYAYPQIDPERIFERDLLMNAATIEQSFAGIELQRRGQIVNAIAADFASQIEIGKMTFQDAQLRLNQINSALDQRRQERETLLQYGVTRASLRTNALGETVTRLPFAEQTASILSMATGQQFRPEDFELGVTAVSPDQAARDVLASSAYTNPVPGLVAGLQATRGAISGIFAEPLGDFAVSDRVTAMATEGVA